MKPPEVPMETWLRHPSNGLVAAILGVYGLEDINGKDDGS
jgi:hypothetical protein